MAITKTGIDYYPRDVGMMRDRKFNKVRQKYGYLVYVIYDALLEMVYSDKGYYVLYNDSTKEEVIWELQDYCRGKYPVEETTIGEVIEMLVACELFSGDHFKQGIITSKRIQEVYYRTTVERRNIVVDFNIWFLTLEEMKNISSKSLILQSYQHREGFGRTSDEHRTINEVNHPNNEDNRPNLKQSKVNKSKVKESKGEREHSPTLDDVRAYCNKKGYINYDCEKFYNYYSSNGWTIKGGVPLVNWQAKLDNWYKEDSKPAISTPKGIFNNYEQKKYDKVELEEIIKRKVKGDRV